MTEWMGSASTLVPRQAPAWSLSRLELLPVEMIERIFFESLEFNLPRASFYIARILSKRSIYTWLIRLAFASPNESSKEDFFTPHFLPVPYSFFALSYTERVKLQSAILSCRWCTLSLMRECQRDYIAHVIRQKCNHLIFSPEDRAILDNIESYFSRPLDFDHNREGLGARHGSMGDFVLSARDPARPNEQLKVAIWIHFGALQIRKGPVHHDMDIFRLPYCYPDTPPRMPDKLLTKPFTPQKLEFLRLLSTLAYIDDDANHARSKKILREVINDRDYDSMDKMIDMCIRTKVYSYPLQWPVGKKVFRTALHRAEGKRDRFIMLLYQRRPDQVHGLDDRRLKDKLLDNIGYWER